MLKYEKYNGLTRKLLFATIFVISVLVFLLLPRFERYPANTDIIDSAVSIIDLLEHHRLNSSRSTFSFHKNLDFPNPILNSDFGPIHIQFDDNWGNFEPVGIWATGEKSAIQVHFDAPVDRQILLRCKSKKHPRTHQKQAIAVSCNGHDCGTVEIGRFANQHRVPIPAEYQVVGANTIEFRFRFHVSPMSLGRGPDSRQLAALFTKITLCDDTGEVTHSTFQRPITINKATETITFTDRAELLVPVSIPPEPCELSFGLATEDHSKTHRSRIDILVEFLDGTRSLLFESDSTTFGSKGASTPNTIDLAPLSGQSCFLVFAADPGNAENIGVSLTSPIIRKTGSIGRQIPALRESASPQIPPDIVVIILDAARADHVGCYGYERNTTPNIDEFAEQALVFTNSFSLVPYTLGSVPTMITGTSFLEHGVVKNTDRLSQECTTLAEALKNSGYHTIAYSATPNNSRAKAFDQGFDEFYELWKGVDGRSARDPHRLTGLAVERLQRDDVHQPLFLQLHYIPPHEPYDPEPRFNLFSNPDYRGSCDGSLETADAINTRRIVPTPEDLAEITALYDGNLRKADDALPALFDALESHRNWDNTVILVTSDHGEALHEHGLIGHNESCLDEMLHVPFILKLAAGTSTNKTDNDRLITLADIAPTLLALAGQSPNYHPWGIDILATPSNTVDLQNRFFIARNANRDTQFALRSLKWKFIMNRTGRSELYDLLADPAEHRNTLVSNPAVHSLLFELTQQHLLTEQVGPPADTVDAISDEDTAMLEALGYLN